MKLLNIFKRSKKNREITDDRLVQIPVYGPHEHLLPRMYCVSSYFAEFESNFERICKEFLKATNLDPYNEGYISFLIDEYVEEAIKALEVQEIAHREVIDDLMMTRFRDVIQAREKFERNEAAIAEVDSELRLFEKIYREGTALEEDVKSRNMIKMEGRNNEESAA